MNNKFTHGYALLIGIEYKHWSPKISRLKGAVKDVASLHMHFTDANKAAYPAENIITLTEEEASAKNIIAALNKLSSMIEKDPEAMVILYYSGHGATDGKEYFLVPYDFDLGRWHKDQTYTEDKVILATQFAKKIARLKAKKSLVILDCCHAENIPVTKSLGKEQQPFLTGFLEDLNTTLDTYPRRKSLASNLNKGTGQVILTSCEAGEESLDFDENGLFTQVLLECLNGEGNRYKDGWVRLEDLMTYIRKEVPERAKAHSPNRKPHQQHPVFKRISNLGSEDFIISAYSISIAKALGGVKKEESAVNNEQKKDITPVLVKDKIISLIEEDIDEALELLDAIFFKKNGTYNDLCREYVSPPNNFSMSSFRSRLRRFVKRNVT